MSVDKKASYYDIGGIEVIDIIRAKLSPSSPLTGVPVYVK